MSDQPETLAAILAKYRKDIAGGQFFTPTQEYILRLLDRIDAAAERERDAHTKDIHDALYMATGIPGNAAALREALERIRPLVRATGTTPYVPERKELVDGALAIIDAALSAPARNCDVGTAEEQAERFKQFCLDNHSAEHLCSRCPLGKQLGDDVDMCQLHWAQMPYAPAKGGAE